MCGEELKARAKQGTFKGKFGPVTHYFGYQSRCSNPSIFDSSLGSTLGFGAAVLIENGLTATAVSVRGILNGPKEFRVSGVPLISLLRSEPKVGYSKTSLVIPSEGVDLEASPY